MEVTNPSLKNRGGISNGLLVRDGEWPGTAWRCRLRPRLQSGADRRRGRPCLGEPNCPNVYGLRGRRDVGWRVNRTESHVGQGVTATIGPNGELGQNAALGGTVTIAQFDANFGHNIPNVFWEFMCQSGPIFLVDRYKTGPNANQPMVRQDGTLAGKMADETVFNWEEAMGYPITEPYWATVRVGGQERTVLTQLFNGES